MRGTAATIVRKVVQAPLRTAARLLERVMLEFTILLLLAGGLLAWWQWDWLTCGDSGSEIVRNLGLVAAAAVALPLAIWRSRVAERQADTAHRAMLDQRFQQALEMAGDGEGALQLTGVHALLKLSAEYPELYEDQVAEILDTFAQFPIGAQQSDNN